MSIPGNFRAPGIHVVEEGGPPRIVPAVTSVGGMVGETLRGRTDKAVLVGSWNAFQQYYGGFPNLPDPHKTGALSAFVHFLNGGGPLWFVRVLGADAVGASKVDLKNNKRGPGADDDALDVYAQSKGAWGDQLSISTQKWTTTCSAVEVQLEGAGDDPDIVVDVKSLEGVRTGDIVNFVDAAGVGQGYAVISNIIADSANYSDRGLLAANSYIVCNDGTKAYAAGDVSADSIIRSASRHLATTRLGAAFAQNDLTVEVESVTGIKIGSFISVVLGAICNDDVNKDISVSGHGRVKAISGKTLTLTVTLKDLDGSNAAPAITADNKAFCIHKGFDGEAADGFEFTAVLDGSDGNAVSVEIKAAQTEADLQAVVPGAVFGEAGAQVYIQVTGNAITIWCEAVAGGDNNNITLGEIETIYNGALGAAARKLATIALVDAGDAGSNVAAADGKAKKFLTGGAFAILVSQEFDLSVKEEGKLVEVHEGLSVAAISADDVSARLGGTAVPVVDDDNQSTRVIVLRDGDIDQTNPNIEDYPSVIVDQPLAGGIEGQTPSDIEALGESAQGIETGIYLLEAKSEISFLSMPGFNTPTVLRTGALFAERNRAVYITETPSSDSSFDSITQFIQGELAVDSSYLAPYAPWIKMADPRDASRRLDVPPSAWVMAEYGLTADTMGVHVPPANRQSMRGPEELAIRLTKPQRDSLHDMGVNVIRKMPGAGFRIYGARLRYSGSDSRKFVNVRRWLNFFEDSIEESFGSLMFLPATTDLMGDIAFIVESFLRGQHDLGALFPDDDFSRAASVKCDSETTTADDLANGRINCEIRVSPVTPAEHIVFGLRVEAGGITITEQVA